LGRAYGGSGALVQASAEIGQEPALALKRKRERVWGSALWALAGGELFLLAREPMDDRINEFLVRRKHAIFGDLSSGITQLGNGAVQLPALWLLHEVGNSHAQEVAHKATSAFLEAGVLTQVLKVTVRRPRPPEDVPGRPRKAFPSGHTATAFAIASVCAEEYGNDWVPYSLATLVALSRVSLEQHHFTDVLGGAILGILCGKRAAQGQSLLEIKF